ncbi:MAG: hypothetical protein IPP67_08175 [Rhodospirillaceae bacterium]|nr:hypothetical protein [Rhodospirillaceae bacterium]
MKKLLLLTGFAALLSTNVHAAELAGKVDLATMTCQQLLDLRDEEAGAVVFWLDGHLTDETVIDIDGIFRVAEALGRQCAQNPSQKLFDAIQKLSSQ